MKGDDAYKITQISWEYCSTSINLIKFSTKWEKLITVATPLSFFLTNQRFNSHLYALVAVSTVFFLSQSSILLTFLIFNTPSKNVCLSALFRVLLKFTSISSLVLDEKIKQIWGNAKWNAIVEWIKTNRTDRNWLDCTFQRPLGGSVYSIKLTLPYPLRESSTSFPCKKIPPNQNPPWLFWCFTPSSGSNRKW